MFWGPIMPIPHCAEVKQTSSKMAIVAWLALHFICIQCTEHDVQWCCVCHQQAWASRYARARLRHTLAQLWVDRAYLVHFQVEHLHIAIIIACQHTALFIVKGVANCYAPAVPAKLQKLDQRQAPCPGKRLMLISQKQRECHGRAATDHALTAMGAGCSSAQHYKARLACCLLLALCWASGTTTCCLLGFALTKGPSYLTLLASAGSNAATGASCCRTSQIRTQPSLPHVTSSGGP